MSHNTYIFVRSQCAYLWQSRRVSWKKIGETREDGDRERREKEKEKAFFRDDDNKNNNNNNNNNKIVMQTRYYPENVSENMTPRGHFDSKRGGKMEKRYSDGTIINQPSTIVAATLYVIKAKKENQKKESKTMKAKSYTFSGPK